MPADPKEIVTKNRMHKHNMVVFSHKKGQASDIQSDKWYRLTKTQHLSNNWLRRYHRGEI